MKRRKILIRIRESGQSSVASCTCDWHDCRVREGCFKERISWSQSVIFSGVATTGNSLVVPEKSKHGVTMGPTFLLLVYPRVIKSRDLKRYLHTCVYSSFINSTDVEATRKVSKLVMMDTQNMVHRHSGILLAVKSGKFWDSPQVRELDFKLPKQGGPSLIPGRGTDPVCYNKEFACHN